MILAKQLLSLTNYNQTRPALLCTFSRSLISLTRCGSHTEELGVNHKFSFGKHLSFNEGILHGGFHRCISVKKKFYYLALLPEIGVQLHSAIPGC